MQTNTQEQSLLELGKIQKQLDKARAKKYAILEKMGKEVIELDKQRASLRERRTALMEVLAR
jgi:hypothetical protein